MTPRPDAPFGPEHPEWCPVGNPDEGSNHAHCGHWYECEPCHRCGDDTPDPNCDCDRCTAARSTPAPSPSQPEPGTLDELRNLRRWKSEATIVLDTWDKVHEALGSPGLPGEHKSSASLAEIERRTAAMRQLIDDIAPPGGYGVADGTAK